MASPLNPPNQVQGTAVFADGVLVFTLDMFINHAVASSLKDGSSTNTVAVTEPNSGQLHFVVTCTPNSAVLEADNTIVLNFTNTASPSA
jgi:hypothetical protein